MGAVRLSVYHTHSGVPIRFQQYHTTVARKSDVESFGHAILDLLGIQKEDAAPFTGFDDLRSGPRAPEECLYEYAETKLCRRADRGTQLRDTSER
jgi:hypothetical protein